jgi:hypothetical protein
MPSPIAALVVELVSESEPPPAHPDKIAATTTREENLNNFMSNVRILKFVRVKAEFYQNKLGLPRQQTGQR